jgi:SAM-dependent methyltransferase
MININCPICGPDTGYKIIYKENLPKEDADFSARKNPDFYHYQMVKCNKCGLLYSNPILENEKINKLYLKSKFTYDIEVENLKDTYGFYLNKVNKIITDKGKLLEVGCGNGFFLEKALEMGYRDITGAEPSIEAINKASPSIQNKIIHRVFNPNDFANNSFDVICFFQVIEHIVDVNGFLSGCFSKLKNGGVFLGVGHDLDSLASRLLKDKCPIINDEHIYVFNRKTLRMIFEKNGFKVLEVGSVANIYSLGYWLNMSPLPHFLKNIFEVFLKITHLHNIKIKLRAGNIYIIAQK